MLATRTFRTFVLRSGALRNGWTEESLARRWSLRTFCSRSSTGKIPRPTARLDYEFSQCAQNGLVFALDSLTRSHRIGQIDGILVESYLRNHYDAVGWFCHKGQSHVTHRDVLETHSVADELNDQIITRQLEASWPHLFH